MHEVTSTGADTVPSRPLRQHPLAVFTFGLLAVVVLWATGKILAPYITPILLALIIVTFTFPIYRRLRTRMKGRSAAAAVLMLLGITVAIFLPAIGLIVMLVEQATQLVEMLQEIDFAAVEASLNLSQRLAPLKRLIPGFRPEAIRLDEAILTIIKQIPAFIANYGTTFLGGFANVIIGFFMMLLASFFFYTEGEHLVHELKFLSPLPDEYDEEIIHKFRSVVDMMKRLKEMAVPVAAAGKMTAEQLKGKVLTGVLYKEDKPEYCEQYAKVIAKAQGA